MDDFSFSNSGGHSKHDFAALRDAKLKARVALDLAVLYLHPLLEDPKAFFKVWDQTANAMDMFTFAVSLLAIFLQVYCAKELISGKMVPTLIFGDGAQNNVPASMSTFWNLRTHGELPASVAELRRDWERLLDAVAPEKNSTLVPLQLDVSWDACDLRLSGLIKRLREQTDVNLRSSIFSEEEANATEVPWRWSILAKRIEAIRGFLSPTLPIEALSSRRNHLLMDLMIEGHPSRCSKVDKEWRSATRLPSNFICPCCNDIMEQPVTLDTGASCCKLCAEVLFKSEGGGRCPETGLNLSNRTVFNHTLEGQIAKWKGAQSVALGGALTASVVTFRIDAGRVKRVGKLNTAIDTGLRAMWPYFRHLAQQSATQRPVVDPEPGWSDKVYALRSSTLSSARHMSDPSAASKGTMNLKRPRETDVSKPAAKRLSMNRPFQLPAAKAGAEAGNAGGRGSRGLDDVREVRSTGTSNFLLSTDNENVPEIFKCPISLEPMRDPVMAADGYTYDRQAIERWFQLKSVSPITNMPLAITNLIPNLTLRSAIKEWQAAVKTV